MIFETIGKKINSKISVYSTKAIDVLLKPNGEIISQQPGGPILFIEKVLKESGMPFEAFSGETVNKDSGISCYCPAY